jgi:hypothetical protein
MEQPKWDPAGTNCAHMGTFEHNKALCLSPESSLIPPLCVLFYYIVYCDSFVIVVEYSKEGGDLLTGLGNVAFFENYQVFPISLEQLVCWTSMMSCEYVNQSSTQ